MKFAKPVRVHACIDCLTSFSMWKTHVIDMTQSCEPRAVLQREQAGCAGSSGDCHTELVAGKMHVDFTDDMHDIIDTSKGAWDVLRDHYTERKHKVNVRTLEGAKHSAENIIETIKQLRAKMALTGDTDANLQGLEDQITVLKKRLRMSNQDHINMAILTWLI